MEKYELNSLTLEELKDYMVKLGEPAFRGEQLFSYFHRNKKYELEDLKLLPMTLRNELQEYSTVNKIKVFKKFNSKIDNTKKYLFQLEDMNIIESVAMEYNHGITACISTQVGCKMGCAFCASTKEGLIRNLTPAEMTNQIYMMENDLNNDISNIVLMGSGEPLDNYNNTLKFLNIIHDEKGHNISLRNITLSTCGVVPKIYDLARENIPITLSISLHSAFNDKRKKIMPIANRYPLEELIEACRYYVKQVNRRITFEYTLINGVNDSDRDINQLIKILNGIKCHINLIPLNPIQEYNKDRPDKAYIERVKIKLEKNGIPTTVRREMGGDISASCGQLRRSVSKELNYKSLQWGDAMVIGAISDIGKIRENNQDAFYLSKEMSLPLYMVADGMGGHKAGEVASTMAMNIIEKNFVDNKDDLTSDEKIINLIKKSIEEANTKIYLKSLDNDKCNGMGTTITLAYIFNNKIFIGHVGDSRAYLIRKNKIFQITEDHSFVNELIKTGSISKEEAKHHPKRNMITRAVGSSSIIEMDLISKELEINDILLLCSDGLFNMVKEDIIVDVFIKEKNIQNACDILANIANDNGGIDNITVVAVKFI